MHYGEGQCHGFPQAGTRSCPGTTALVAALPVCRFLNAPLAKTGECLRNDRGSKGGPSNPRPIVHVRWNKLKAALARHVFLRWPRSISVTGQRDGRTVPERRWGVPCICCASRQRCAVQPTLYLLAFLIPRASVAKIIFMILVAPSRILYTLPSRRILATGYSLEYP